MGVKVYLSINQEELLEELRGVEVGGRKGRGSDDESRSTTPNLRVDKNGGGLEVLQCRNGGSTDREGRYVDVRQQIVVSWVGSAITPQRQDFCGVIDPLLSWRESVGR
ncbi:hypothetical protein B296_00038862 [Ensete ventricosum]|uniref:Uncharacterized protein n=1 Tax=Ensete ventricosum TaxID=4639 RepID=A0A426ZV57_ENSVE|nr:hypothetical protein B296_00038862 [Ensete ventricosum]